MVKLTDKPMMKTELLGSLDDRKTAAEAVTVLINIITEQVAAGREVKITGFLSIAPYEQPARNFRNPQTGETVQTPADGPSRRSWAPT
jgi:DNA-binding protein HU-beta